MNKIAKFFKNRKVLTGLTVGVACTLAASITLGVMLPSYFSWKSYYDAAIAEREHQKYLQSLPFDCKGITATLNDNVTYYANGKADPTADDFTVIAHFTEKGTDFDEILLSDAFTVSAENGFAKNGGTVTVTYVYTPEAPETEEGDEPQIPESKEFTQEISCTLEAVVPVSVARINTPYILYYGEGTPFDGDGLNALVTFNDGSTEKVGNDEFVYGDGALTAGTKNVTVTWSRGGTTFDFECPVTVVPAEEFDDGAITAIMPADTVYIDLDAETSKAKFPVRATYASGNRRVIDEALYTVSGNTPRASLTQKCLLTAALDSDPTVTAHTFAVVKSSIKASDASFTLAEEERVFETVRQDGKWVTSENETTVIAPLNNASISFDIRSDAISKPVMSLRVALRPVAPSTPDDGSEETPDTPDGGETPDTPDGGDAVPSLHDLDGDCVDLSSVVTMVVNDRAVKLPSGMTLAHAAGAEDKYVFYDITFPAPLLRNCVNSVRFVFRGDNANKIVVDRVNLENGYGGKFYASAEDYLIEQTEAGNTAAKFDAAMIKGWGAFGAYSDYYFPHGMCTDGTYLYVLVTNFAEGTRPYRVIKYTADGRLIATSYCFVGDEAKVDQFMAGLSYYDNKIIVSLADGSHVYFDAATFANEVKITPYDGFDRLKEQVGEGEKVTDVYYNSSKLKFAVMTDARKIYLFDDKMNLLKSFGLTDATAGIYRMTGTADHIYVNYSADGWHYAKLAVYDWDENSAYTNNYIGMQRLYTGSALQASGINNYGAMNIQGITVIDGNFYVSMSAWGDNNTNGGSLWRFSTPRTSDALDPELSYGEYIDECVNGKATPKMVLTPTVAGVDMIGTIKDTVGYSMGGVSDGKYVYIANNREGNSCFVVTKLDGVTYEPICYSVMTPIDPEVVRNRDNSRMFIKDGKLYVVAGDVYSISLDDFAPNCSIKKDEEMTRLLSLGGNIVVKSAYWNESQRKYVVLDYCGDLSGRDVYILDESGAVVKMFSVARDGQGAAAVTGDDGHIYVLYNWFLLDVLSYDGSKLYGLNVSGITLGPNVQFNLQDLYLHNGTMHFSVCSWTEGQIVYHDWTGHCDMSVFEPMTVGKYLSDCFDRGVVPALYGKASVGNNGYLPGTRESYAKGGVSDGNWLYIASGDGDMVVQKVDLATYTVNAMSAPFGIGGDKGRLFIKDGVLYCVGNDVYSIELSDFGQGCTFTKDDAMKTFLTCNGSYGMTSAYYNASEDKYVVLADDQGVLLLNGDGSTASWSNRNRGNGWMASSVCGDENFYYVSHRTNAQEVLPIDVFRWDGTLVTTLNVSGVCAGAAEGGNYNIQAIYMVNGKLHAGVCTWSAPFGCRDWTIEFDTSVLA